MGMLKSISLKNYKCFDKLKVDGDEELEIAPLTILCGVNSSGKSSIIKSLLMLKQSFEDNSISNSMLFNGKYVDNGSFSEIKCDYTKSSTFTISNSFEIAKLTKKITKDATNLRDLRRLYYNNNIQKFVIHYSIFVVNGDNLFYSNKISKIDISIDVYKNNEIDFISNLSLKKIYKNKYNIYFENIPDVSGKLGSYSVDACTCYFNAMTLNSIYKESMNNIIKLFIPAIISIFNIVSTQYSQIKYIAPLRENPKRRYIIDKNVNDVGLSGENTPLLLEKVSSKLWTSILAPVDENNIKFSESQVTEDIFVNILNSWMKYLELGVISVEANEEIIKVKINRHNISDVGFGVSQALPILTEGIFLSPNQTLLLEQPEIHLHPKMQMRMADFLLSLTILKKQVVVETHSDHFINRIVRRYMEDKIIRDNVNIYFIDKDKHGLSSITKIHIDEVNGAICENENFFYQFASETERIIDAGYKNLKVRQETEENNCV